jgi:hypothetical protein
VVLYLGVMYKISRDETALVLDQVDSIRSARRKLGPPNDSRFSEWSTLELFWMRILEKELERISLEALTTGVRLAAQQPGRIGQSIEHWRIIRLRM